LEKLNDSEEANNTWGNIEENFKNSGKESLGPYEMKQKKMV